MLARVSSAGLYGIDAHHVVVEVDISRGLPGWHMVGLPETVVRESKDRVTAALRNAGHNLPQKRTTINLAPARHKKSGTFFDLPIAVGLLEAARVLPAGVTRRWLCVGELSLSGDLHPVPGALAVALLARRRHYHLIIPAGNAAEVGLITGLDWIAAAHLNNVVQFFLEGRRPPRPVMSPPLPPSCAVDLQEVRGQAIGRRALEIAAAGGHHLFFIGSPGTGKTMLAQRLTTILPPLAPEEMIDVARIYSVYDDADHGGPPPRSRPFRAPHHSATIAGIVGGGPQAQVGEITLAHHGILFLDELGEFHRDVIEVLRQPIEAGQVTIARAAYRCKFPARFMLVTATNPCRCGYYGHPTIPCICSMQQIQWYRSKFSGPLLDRIDLHVELGSMTPAEQLQRTPGEASQAVRARVVQARTRQTERYRRLAIRTNGELTPRQLTEFCSPSAEGAALLLQAIERQGLSARAHDRILRVARTIADLAGDATIAAPHIAEALQYRALDRPL